ncbi:hypothetical protein, partial [Stenotrophomonas maltophilia]|uniref:hypothetical protein n=1 Tax=Stenotrophomonas maltophilia TaxID=40324 RepID=UPI00195320D9
AMSTIGSGLAAFEVSSSPLMVHSLFGICDLSVQDARSPALVQGSIPVWRRGGGLARRRRQIGRLKCDM